MRVGDLALLSDCRTSALVDLDGAIVWWPAERFDGPSVFTRLLDPEAGHFSLRPAAGVRETRRRYLDGTLVLETEHAVDGAVLRVTDALAFAPGARGHEIGLEGASALVRVAEAVGGDVDVEAELVPRPEYGLAVPRVDRQNGQIVTIGGPERLYVADGGMLEPGDRRARGRLTLRAGERRGIVVRRADDVEGAAPAALDPLATLEDTIAAWRSWSQLHTYDGPYREQVLHAGLVVQGLTYQPTGAVVAAATTSLPEKRGDTENWDYRFAWLRDASLVARALLAASCFDEARRYFGWMARAAVGARDSDHVQCVYGVGGERALDERELDHLAGFAGSRPVRVGNTAWRQRQLDVVGEILEVARALGDDLEIDAFTQAFLCQLADRAE